MLRQISIKILFLKMLRKKSSHQFFRYGLIPILQLGSSGLPLQAQGSEILTTETGKPIVKRTVSLESECPLIHPIDPDWKRKSSKYNDDPANPMATCSYEFVGESLTGQKSINENRKKYIKLRVWLNPFIPKIVSPQCKIGIVNNCEKRGVEFDSPSTGTVKEINCRQTYQGGNLLFREGNSCFYSFTQSNTANFKDNITSAGGEAMLIRSVNIASLCPVNYVDAGGKKYLRYDVKYNFLNPNNPSAECLWSTSGKDPKLATNLGTIQSVPSQSAATANQGQNIGGNGTPSRACVGRMITSLGCKDAPSLVEQYVATKSLGPIMQDSRATQTYSPATSVLSASNICPIRSWHKTPNGFHFYAPSAEADPPGWIRESIRFGTFKEKASSEMQPLYRMFRPDKGGHFYTTNAEEKNHAISNGGFVNENHIGYVYTIESGPKYSDLVPLHRWHNPKVLRHFYSTSKSEGDNAGFDYEGIIGYVIPPSSAQALATTPCLVSSLDAGKLQPIPIWAYRDERCFGAVGSGCGGFGEWVGQFAIKNIKVVDTKGLLNINWPRGLPVGCQDSTCWVSSGSIKHDNCCLRNPSGYACGGGNSNPNACKAEWDEAEAATLKGLLWYDKYNPGQRADLSPTASPNNRYAAGEVQETAKRCAPDGSNLLPGTEGFCCSGNAVRYNAIVSSWIKCVPKNFRSIQVGPIQEAEQPIILPTQDNLQKINSGVSRDQIQTFVR